MASKPTVPDRMASEELSDNEIDDWADVDENDLEDWGDDGEGHVADRDTPAVPAPRQPVATTTAVAPKSPQVISSTTTSPSDGRQGATQKAIEFGTTSETHQAPLQAAQTAIAALGTAHTNIPARDIDDSQAPESGSMPHVAAPHASTVTSIEGANTEPVKTANRAQRDAAEDAISTAEITEVPAPQRVAPANEASSLSDRLPPGSPDPSWGWSGGWSAFSRKLKDVAAGVGRDMHELQESLNRVLIDTKSETEPSSGVPTPPPSTPVSINNVGSSSNIMMNSAAAPPIAAPSAAPMSRDAAIEPEEVRKRLEDAERLNADEEGDGVDPLTSSAAKAFGSLFGGLGGAMKGGLAFGQRVAQQVERVARDAAKEVVETVGEGVRDLSELRAIRAASGGIRTLRTKAGELVTYIEGDGGRRASVDDSNAATFENCFRMYGGAEFFDELEQLSNDCARRCNVMRSAAEESLGTTLDAALLSLSPLFELKQQSSKDGSSSQRGAAAAAAAAASGSDAMRLGDDDAVAAVDATDALTARYKPLSEVCEAGMNKAWELTGLAMDVVRNAQLQSGSGAVAGQGDIDEAITRIRMEGVKRIAQICALAIEHLLHLARSLPPHRGAAAQQQQHGELTWPPTHIGKATLLRQQAAQMLLDLRTVAQSFVDAVAGVSKSAGLSASASPNKPNDGALPQMAAALQKDGTTATTRVQDAFRSVLYIVLASTLPASDPPSAAATPAVQPEHNDVATPQAEPIAVSESEKLV